MYTLMALFMFALAGLNGATFILASRHRAWAYAAGAAVLFFVTAFLGAFYTIRAVMGA